MTKDEEIKELSKTIIDEKLATEALTRYILAYLLMNNQVNNGFETIKEYCRDDKKINDEIKQKIFKSLNKYNLQLSNFEEKINEAVRLQLYNELL